MDFFLGVPLLLLLSILRRRRKQPSPIRRIALFVSAAIGDAILASPLLRDLKSTYPDAELVLVHGASNRGLEPFLKDICQFVEIDVKNPFRAWAQMKALGHYDLWIDTGQWARMPALLSWLAPAAWTVGFQAPGQYRHFLYDVFVSHDSKVHELENFRKLLQPLGIKGTHFPRFEVDTLPHPQKIVVHMFAGGSRPAQKELDFTQWVELINGLTQGGFEVVLTGARVDRSKAERVRAACSDGNRIENVAGHFSLEDTARMLKSAAWVISVNTGILHLAAAVGARVMGLHGPTSALRWGPVGRTSLRDSRHLALQSSLPCSPCLNFGFDYGCPLNRCMQAFGTKELVKKVVP